MGCAYFTRSGWFGAGERAVAAAANGKGQAYTNCVSIGHRRFYVRIISNQFCRLVDLSDRREIVSFDLYV
jgi:hypothetical protein